MAPRHVAIFEIQNKRQNKVKLTKNEAAQRQSSDIVNNNSAQTLNEILTPWQKWHILAFQEQFCQITERQQKLLRN